jgi:hypothetical protein
MIHGQPGVPILWLTCIMAICLNSDFSSLALVTLPAEADGKKMLAATGKCQPSETGGLSMAIISDIEQQVFEALEQDKRTNKYAIEVIDENGLVTLKGKVYTEEDRKIADEIASRQRGVIKVIDEMEITKPDDGSKLMEHSEIINRAPNE